MNLDTLISGGKAALARCLAGIEEAGSQDQDDPRLAAFLDEAFVTARAMIIGVTGPPGVGKSTLISALIKAWRAQGLTVGVIAVDPSSKRSGGALLGDRTRIVTGPEDDGVFIRSMAARDQLGGLSALTNAAAVLMRALYDRVIVETVGVGQSETGISTLADTVVFCVQPGSGDSLQFMKAGIAEVPDLAVVTKADLGPPAARARADLEGALGLAADGTSGIPVMMVSASNGTGLGELAAAIDGHGGGLQEQGVLEPRRMRQAQKWVIDDIRIRYGSDGLKRLGPRLSEFPADRPFAAIAALSAHLQERFQP